jgi:uncharacterized membrane protein
MPECLYNLVNKVHIVAGVVALFVGPWQFVPYIRRRWITFHRLSGRVYVLAVLISGPLAFVVSFHSPAAWAVAGTAIQSVLWFVTTLAAYRSIKCLRIDAHRRWMMLSYSLTLTAPTVRIGIVVLERIFMIDYQGDFEYYYALLVWFSFLPLLIAWVYINFCPKCEP